MKTKHAIMTAIDRTRRGYPVIVSAGLLTLTLLLSGCATDQRRASLQPKGESSQVQSGNGIEVTLTFLDEATIRSRYGRPESNPFLTLQNTLMFRRIVPFELRITNRRDELTRLQINRLEMQFAGRVLEPTNRFQLTQYWIVQDDENSGVQIGDHRRKEAAINSHMLPDRASLASGRSESGLVVFMGDLPRYGSADIYVPVIDGNGNEVQRFKFTFEF